MARKQTFNISSCASLACLLLMFLVGCSSYTPPPEGFYYKNVKTEGCATIIQQGTLNFFSLGYGHGVAMAIVAQIDGVACGVWYEDPVYISAGDHDMIFRFNVSNAPVNELYQPVTLSVEAGAVYHIRAKYESNGVLSGTPPDLHFTLTKTLATGGEEIAFENKIPFIVK